jgi:hypothetical protein
MPVNEYLSTVQAVFTLLLAAGGGIMAILMLKLRKEFVSRADFDNHCGELDVRLRRFGAQYDKLAEDMAETPSAADIKELRQAINAMTANLGILKESLRGQNELFLRLEAKVDRIDVYLMRQQ